MCKIIPLKKSPLVLTVRRDKPPAAYTPLQGSPEKPDEGQLSHLLQAPLTACRWTPSPLAARPHLKAAIKSLIPSKGQNPGAPETAAQG